MGFWIFLAIAALVVPVFLVYIWPEKFPLFYLVIVVMILVNILLGYFVLECQQKEADTKIQFELLLNKEPT